MPALSTIEAAEKLVRGIENAKQSDLGEIYAELFPERQPAIPPTAAEIIRHVRSGLEAEELVDLWNVVYPGDDHVWYDEEANAIRYNDELVGQVD